MIGIHNIHRKLAEITAMSIDENGCTRLGVAELSLIIPLLRQNLQMVQQLDGYKQLAYHAYEMGDMAWQHEICAKIDELEASLI